MSKLERKRLKKYLDKARRETNLSLTEQEIEEIIKEGEEKTMNDKDKKEIKKKGLLGINKKTKAWLLAVLVACGVTKCTYDKVNQINENDLPEEPTLEEAQDEIRKFIEKETEIDPNEINVFEDQENELEEAENQNTQENTMETEVKQETEDTLTKEEAKPVEKPKETKPVEAPKEETKPVEKPKETKPVEAPKEMEMPTIAYDPTTLTNGNVIVTISAKEKIKPVEGWTLLEDGKTLTREYITNTDETVTIYNLNGGSKDVRVLIQNIDKTFNKVTVNYKTLTNGNVLVTITSDEELRPVKGWTLSEDKKVLSKEYTKTTKEEITIFDNASNSQKVLIDVKIENKTNESTNKDDDNDRDNDKDDDNTQVKPNPKPEEPNPKPEEPNPKPEEPDPKPEEPDPKPEEPDTEDREEVEKDNEDGTGLTEGEEDDIQMGGGKTESSNSQDQETETEKQTKIQALYELREIVLQNGLVFEYDVPVEESKNVLQLKM